MTDERTRRVQAVLDELEADWAVLTSQEAVAYGLQHIAAVEAGPSPWDGGPTTGVISRDGTVGLVCHELEVPVAQASAVGTSDGVIVSYECLGFTDHRPLGEKYAASVAQLFDQLDVGGVVAVEGAQVLTAVTRAVEERATATRTLTQALNRQRAIKTEAEVAALRRCAEVTAAGHAVVRAGGHEGRTELELFHDVRAAMEDAAGQRCAVTGDLVSGQARTAAVGGWPGTREMGPGDAIIADLAPRVDGYWGDSCTTTCIGEPTPALADLYRLVHHAWEQVLETLRPGVTAHDFDASIRSIITDAGFANPVHIGHSIGTSVHEWPRIIPGEHAVLQAGMVVLVEPGGYRDDVGGVRLEKMFLITEDGNEPLSPFDIPPALPSV
ncbi:M24 family metallopeptidase [Euzebya tangerina]|uniref:M24 family metallopeptidase n=1 Tax=Euzebya tangerina TaxID=591198 RepID=UPI000E31907A|nr:Xaa-Pro peptidase family protein [Euzebya tangerina]